MKSRIIYFLPILTVLLLTACNERSDYNALLVKADSLMALRPDSALHILQNIQPSKLKTQADHAYYALLLTQAQDKNYIVQADDSLIQIAVRYYNAHGDAAMQARAYYYWGSVCRDQNMQAEAIEKFLMAIPLVQATSDKSLLGRIYNNIGYLYYLQKLYTKADSIFRQAEEIGIQQKDTILQSEALTMQGSISLIRSDYLQAENKLLQAQTVSESSDQSRLKFTISNALSLLYSRIGDKKKALQYAKMSISLQEDTTHCYYSFLVLGEAYFKTGKYDSASYYLSKSLTSPDYGIKADACMRLADIANKQGDTSASLVMERMYSAYRDSMEQYSQHTKILEAEQRMAIQKQRTRYESYLNKYFLVVIVLITVCMGILLLSVNYHFRHRRQEQQQLERENELRQKYIRQKEQHTALINKTRKYSEVIQKIDNILAIYKKKKIPKEFLDENDWVRLQAEVDPQGIINSISEKYKLSEMECHLCCLLLLDYSIADVGRIIQRERMSVYRMEHAISKKMGTVANIRGLFL